MDRHHQDFLNFADIGTQNFDGRFGIEHNRRLHPQFAHALKSAVQIAIGLDMQLQRLRAGGGERLEIQVGATHHQMHIAVKPGRDLPAERDHVGPEGKVGHKAGIHNVDMQRVRKRIFGTANFVGQRAVVGREQRRQNLRFHLKYTFSQSLRILPPALPSTAPS